MENHENGTKELPVDLLVASKRVRQLLTEAEDICADHDLRFSDLVQVARMLQYQMELIDEQKTKDEEIVLSSDANEALDRLTEAIRGAFVVQKYGPSALEKIVMDGIKITIL